LSVFFRLEMFLEAKTFQRKNQTTQLNFLSCSCIFCLAVSCCRRNYYTTTIMTNPTSTTVTTTPPAASVDITQKCRTRGSKVRGAEKLICAADGCNKTVHFMCYQGAVLMDKKHTISFPPLPSFRDNRFRTNTTNYERRQL
jgi:hypothetical protein